MEISEIRKLYSDVLENVRRVIIGKDELFTLIFSAMLTGGHVLIEDNPGTGKTMLARSISKSIGCSVRRVQFTPDLMPQDITGLNIFSQKTSEFSLVKGPIFTNILLADEINRATPRTQSALLEAMEERSVTIDGTTLMLERPFLVIATENPIETVGTYPLPEAQLDRFLIRVPMGVLSTEEELNVLRRYEQESPFDTLNAVASAERMNEAFDSVRNVRVSDPVKEYIVNLSDATRKSSKIVVGVSPRASLQLMHLSQSFAAISGRDFVTPDDVRFLAPYVFGHRIITYSETGAAMNTELIKDIMKTVTVPVEDWQ